MTNQISLDDELFLSKERIDSIRAHIKKTWKTQTRSHDHILEAAKDPKLEHCRDRPWPIYISLKEDPAVVEKHLQEALSPEEFEQIEVKVLPAELDALEEHGLLYLPHEYVVPGGRFNEMYGWDSYFIMSGLLRDGEISLAKNMVEQLLYEIEHYGTVLNANRTYYLNRSQPPFLTRMILELFEYTQDVEWLCSALPEVESYYFYWVVPPHLNQATGLSHYNALGRGPAPEVESSEKDDKGRTHYERVKEYYRHFQVEDYDVKLYYNKETDSLTDLFYQGDRSMRESGLDITNRFGPFSVDIIHYAPVCLNVLLYQMERDIAQINQIIGNHNVLPYWNRRAQERHWLIDRFLWDEESGLYFDYNFRTGKRRHYEFATTFFPLWAGLASESQAKRLVENLELFDAPGGLLTSTHVSGCQWDAPFGWAPLQSIAVGGLRRYGYHKEAEGIARKFLNMVMKEFCRTETIVEKYDLEMCSADVSGKILFGYPTNEIGFGWTNAVVLEFLAILE